MAGRPTQWSEEIEDSARDYINGGWNLKGEPAPSVVGLAIHINIAKSTVYAWAQEGRGTFSDIVSHCNDMQHLELTKKGLQGEINSTITKLMLSKHGYSENTKTELTGADGGAIKTDNAWTINVVGD